MASPSRSQLLWILAVGLAVVVLGALWARGGAGAAGGDATVPIAGPGAGGDAGAGVATVAVTDDAATARIVVHVAGAVRRPGVYKLPAGTRVAGAIRRAGGARHRADLDTLNLAAKLTDGRQVLVPWRPAPAGGGGAAALSESAAGAAAGGLPVNLNSATAQELDALEGIGPVTAQKIVDYREEHGGFASVDDLDAVPGIGPATVESLRDEVTV